MKQLIKVQFKFNGKDELPAKGTVFQTGFKSMEVAEYEINQTNTANNGWSAQLAETTNV